MPTVQLSISQLLSTAFEAFKKNSGSIVPAFVGLQTIVFLLTYLLNAPFLNILMLPVVLFMQIAILKSFKSPQEKFNTDEVFSLKDADLKDKLWRLFWSHIVYVILIILLFILLIIPGIIFMVYWYFFSYIILDQGLSGMSALKKSKEMVTNHWWKTFGIVAIGVIISIAISSVLTGISGQDALIGGLLMAVSSGLISVYFGYVAVAYYFNLKK